ncbi:MAG: DUF2520 domain-containing protein [Actinobacteria bacterium]|nr:DUF2520 domain-containing protein [Actinomycetota bacterium]
MENTAIIGAGKVGTAIAIAVSGAGYSVTGVVDTDSSAGEKLASLTGARLLSDPGQACLNADLVIVTTPDSLIAAVCEEIGKACADLRGKKVMHMSGALSLEVLEPAERKGADVLCIHPLQTFADLEGAVKALPGSRFGVTCAPGFESWARGFVEAIGGTMLPVDDSDKVLYHAAAVMACNLITMVVFGAEVLYRGLGFTPDEARTAFMPLLNATVDNIERLGPSQALTGPLSRGDVSTIGMHLGELKRVDRELLSLYREVSIWGLKLVEEQGTADEESIQKMRVLLEEF